MCHEKYHYDPDLRAIANYLSGLPSAQSTNSRELSSMASQLLLNTACCVGLQDYVKDVATQMSSGERSRLSVKLKAIRQRLAYEADAILAALQGDPEKTPF